MNGVFVIGAIILFGAIGCWACERHFDLVPEKQDRRQCGHIMAEATRGNLTTIRAQYAEIGFFPARRWRHWK